MSLLTPKTVIKIIQKKNPLGSLFPHRWCCRITKANTAAKNNNVSVERGKLIIHDFDPHSRNQIHSAVIFSSIQIKKLLGMCKSSEKKMRDEQSKNTVKKGPNIRLPIIVIKDKGSPQATRTGREIKEIKNCTCTNVVSHLRNTVIVLFMNISINRKFLKKRVDSMIQSLLLIVSYCLVANIIGAEPEKQSPPPKYLDDSSLYINSSPKVESANNAALALLQQAYNSGKDEGDGLNVKGSCNLICLWPSCPINVSITPLLSGIKLALLNCLPLEGSGQFTDNDYKNPAVIP